MNLFQQQTCNESGPLG